MQTLDEFNKRKYDDYAQIKKLSEPHTNGIECPRCQDELWDSQPMVTLTSDPPQKNVHCPSCGYSGYRLA